MNRESGLIYHVKMIAINGEKNTLHGDSGYIGTEKRPEAVTRNKKGKKIKYVICRKPSYIKKLSKSDQYAAWKIEHRKSSVRCKVEHVFAVVKKLFGYLKNRYQVCWKQNAKNYIMFALTNLYWLIENLCQSDSVCPVNIKLNITLCTLPGAFHILLAWYGYMRCCL